MEASASDLDCGVDVAQPYRPHDGVAAECHPTLQSYNLRRRGTEVPRYMSVTK